MTKRLNLNQIPNCSNGYMTVPYVKAHYPDSNPLSIRFALENAGIVAPSIQRVCELGCGYGHNLLVHAAANPTIQWTGIDFNPDFILYAQKMAEKFSITNVEFIHQSFDSLVPTQYDYIILHGVWSWISAANREHLLSFIQQSLVLGGVLYLGYNAKAGWTSLLPIRDLMFLAFHTANLSLPIDDRVKQALKVCRSFIELNPSLSNNQFLVDRFNQIEQENTGYLCHEYLNKDWELFSPSEVSQSLADIGLQYCGSPNHPLNIDAINLTPPELAFIEQDSNLKEDLKSHFLNELFRRDLFVKGKLTSSHDFSPSFDYQFRLAVPLSAVSLTLDGLRLQIQLREDIYWPLLERLKTPCSFSQLQEVVNDPSCLNEALNILVGHKLVSLLRNHASPNEPCQLINKYSLANIGQSSFPFVSPILGGEIRVPIEHQYLALARSLKRPLPELIQDAELLRTVSAKTNEFYDDYLPLYKSSLCF